jgi:hypothetical protein
VLALTCHIELFTQTHYRASIGAGDDGDVSELYQDVFLFHWKEESQHAVLDELEWQREDKKLSPAQRDAAVDDLIALVGGVDGLLQAQAAADAAYVVQSLQLAQGSAQAAAVQEVMLKAYRWQYIVSGVQEPRFQQLLASMVTEAQMARVLQALQPLMGAQPRQPLRRPAPVAEGAIA